MKRRAAVEPGVGHPKNKHRLERNRLKGVAGDALNAILAAAAMNSHKLLGAFGHTVLRCRMHIRESPSALQATGALQTPIVCA